MGQADRDISARELQIISVSEPERVHGSSASWPVGSQDSSVL